MPSIQNYEKKTAKKPKAQARVAASTKPRRRPGRDEEIKAHTHMENTENKKAETTESSQAEQTQTEQAQADRKKVHIEFYGSELIKAKVPKAFEVAENVAEEWVNDGDFTHIPVGHPLAQQVAALGLQKAKKIEKKLEEKGVFMIAKMGIEYAKSKLKK